MLAKKYRLNLSLKQNSAIFSKEEAVELLSSDYFLAYLRPNQTYLQVACLTPRTAIHLATRRNFYRRFMYNLLLKKLNDKTSSISFDSQLDLVIVLKKKFTQDKQILERDMFNLIARIETKLR